MKGVIALLEALHLPEFDASEALCKGEDPDMFFPAIGKPAARVIETYCNPCPIKNKCREFATQFNMSYGIWGGTNYKNRQTIRNSRRKAG